MDFKQNYFALFDLVESFQIDIEELTGKYTRLQQSVHPDRYSQATEQQQRLSLQYSVFINEAYNTLKKPLTRAAYLLELAGIDTSGNENAPVDTEFLMQQMELREALEEIDETGGGEAALRRLDELKTHIKNLGEGMEAGFEQAYLSHNLVEAEQLVYKMQFAGKLLSAVQRIEEKLLDY